MVAQVEVWGGSPRILLIEEKNLPAAMFVVRTSLVLLLTLGSWRTGVDGAFLPASVQALDADADALDASDASDAPQVRLSGAPVNYALLQYSPYEAMPVAAFKPSEPEQYYPIRRVRNQTHPAGFNYHTSNTELAPYVSSLPINHGYLYSTYVHPKSGTLVFFSIDVNTCDLLVYGNIKRQFWMTQFVCLQIKMDDLLRHTINS